MSNYTMYDDNDILGGSPRADAIADPTGTLVTDRMDYGQRVVVAIPADAPGGIAWHVGYVAGIDNDDTTVCVMPIGKDTGPAVCRVLASTFAAWVACGRIMLLPVGIDSPGDGGHDQVRDGWSDLFTPGVDKW
jgi:hypothetical protein